jgi:multicomponent Na+:H+ antiporter subunit E
VSRILAIALPLAAVWILVSGDPGPGQFLLGLGFGILFALGVAAPRTGRPRLAELPRRAADLGFYALVLMPLDLARSNLSLARRLLRLRPAVRPGIVRLPIEAVSEAALGLEQHAITLSPGQMLVEHAPEEQAVYVHVVDVTEAAARRARLERLARGPLGRSLA